MVTFHINREFEYLFWSLSVFQSATSNAQWRLGSDGCRFSKAGGDFYTTVSSDVNVNRDLKT